ncbi:hypothetical protein BH10ACT1_BH10ACT1_33960 [soil metagenome]
MDEISNDDAGGGAFDRRRFLKRVAIGSAVAVPVVSSFSMSGVNAAFAQQTNVSGKKPASSGTDTTPTTDDGGVSGESTIPGETSTTTTTTAPNQPPSTTTSTTSPNQPPSTTTSTTSPNQPVP